MSTSNNKTTIPPPPPSSSSALDSLSLGMPAATPPYAVHHHSDASAAAVSAPMMEVGRGSMRMDFVDYQRVATSGKLLSDLNLLEWKHHYQRNNQRNKFKNLRCFPCCARDSKGHKKHVENAFCGTTVDVRLQMSAAHPSFPKMFRYTERTRVNVITPMNNVASLVTPAGSKVDSFSSAAVLSGLSSLEGTEFVMLGEISPYRGQKGVNHVSACPRVMKEPKRQSELQERTKRPGHLRRDCFLGRAKALEYHSDIDSTTRQWTLSKIIVIMEFNNDKRSWHYGFQSSYIYKDIRHHFSAHLFERCDDGSSGSSSISSSNSSSSGTNTDGLILEDDPLYSRVGKAEGPQWIMVSPGRRKRMEKKGTINDIKRTRSLPTLAAPTSSCWGDTSQHHHVNPFIHQSFVNSQLQKVDPQTYTSSSQKNRMKTTSLTGRTTAASHGKGVTPSHYTGGLIPDGFDFNLVFQEDPHAILQQPYYPLAGKRSRHSHHGNRRQPDMPPSPSMPSEPDKLSFPLSISAAERLAMRRIPKAPVNVFGAKQYHPVLQTTQVESYYVKFYMFIVGGALVGGIILPIVTQYNIYAAYIIPPCMMTLALFIFLLGTRRYVKPKPNKTDLWNTLLILGQAAVCYKSMDNQKVSKGGTHRDTFVDGIKQFLCVIPITALTIPFNVAYTQLTGALITQGQAMQPAGFLDAVVMNNCEALSVLIFGFVFDSYLNPLLYRRGIRLSICHKFAIGTFCGTMSMAVAAIIDYGIHANLAKGQLVSVGYQVFIYLFMGAGEIFVYAMAYEAAFEVAPKEQKGMASAFNLFLIGSVPGFIETVLQNALTDWLPPCQASGQGVEAVKQCYGGSNMSAFFWVAAGIAGIGVLLNVLPPINHWVERVQANAVENNKKSAIEAKPLVEGVVRERGLEKMYGGNGEYRMYGEDVVKIGRNSSRLNNIFV